MKRVSIGSKIETKIYTKWKKIMQNPGNLFKLDQLYVHISLEIKCDRHKLIFSAERGGCTIQ